MRERASVCVRTQRVKEEIEITINSKQHAKSAVTNSARFSDRREKFYAYAQNERKRERKKKRTKLDGRTFKRELVHFGVYFHPIIASCTNLHINKRANKNCFTFSSLLHLSLTLSLSANDRCRFSSYYNFLGVLRIQFMCWIVCSVCIKALTNAPQILPSHTISLVLVDSYIVSLLFFFPLYFLMVFFFYCFRRWITSKLLVLYSFLARIAIHIEDYT